MLNAEFKQNTCKCQFKVYGIRVFPKIVVLQKGWFIRENPIRIDDFGGTPIFGLPPIHVRSWYFHIVMSSAKFKSNETTIVVSIFCWGRTPKNPGSPILIMIS